MSEDPSAAPTPSASPAQPEGVQGGGVQVQAAPRVLRVHAVKAGLLAGRSIKRLARELGITRASVQEHARRLLSTGQLVKVEGRYYPGPAGKPAGGVQGRVYTPGHTPVPPTNTRDPAPPHRIDVATDMMRRFRIVQPPAIVDKVPGFVITKPKGQRKGQPTTQLLHEVNARDAAGRVWNLWLESSTTTGRWSLWVGKVQPPPRFVDFQRPGETPDAATDRLTSQVVYEWAASAGLVVVPIPGKTRPVAVTFPGTVPPGLTWRDGQTTADGTPPHANGWNTLELQSYDAERTRLQQEAHVALPETTKQVADHEAWRHQADAMLADLRRFVLGHLELDVKRQTAANYTAMAQLPDGIAAKPSTTSPPRPTFSHDFI